MNLYAFIALAVLFAAGIIFMEIKFAKMNKTEEEQFENTISRVLRKFGATKISSDGKGWFNFWLDDEFLWINATNAPLIEVILQNSIERCPDEGIAKQIAHELSSRLAGGRVAIKDANIYIEWESILAGEDALKEGLPLLFSYLAQVREKYVNAYWEALASKNHDNTKVVS